MKKQFFLSMTLILFAFVGFGQFERPPDDIAPEPGVQIEQPAAPAPALNLEDVAQDVLQIIARDSNAIAVLPGGGFDATDITSIFDWWIFLFSLIMPFGLWVFHRFFPSVTKKELILKSTSVAVVVLMIIIGLKGMTLAVIGQAVLAFIMKVVAYDKVLQPLGLDSPKSQEYENPAEIEQRE